MNRDGETVVGTPSTASRSPSLREGGTLSVSAEGADSSPRGGAKKTAAAEGGQYQAFSTAMNGLANDKLQPYGDELRSIIARHGDIIIESRAQLEEMVNDAFENPDKKATAYFGILTSNEIQNIENSMENVPKELCGKLFKPGKDYSVIAEYDYIRHITDEKKRVSMMLSNTWTDIQTQ